MQDASTVADWPQSAFFEVTQFVRRDIWLNDEEVQFQPGIDGHTLDEDTVVGKNTIRRQLYFKVRINMGILTKLKNSYHFHVIQFNLKI